MARLSWRQMGMFTLSLGLAGCASLPEISRTQAVRDIKIEMQLTPDELEVAPGDEVRWVNLRKEWVLVQIPALDARDLLCQKGFSDWRSHLKESVKLAPNETVSLCFKDAADVLYNVRADTALVGGSLVLSGTVRVVVPEAS